MLFNNLLLSLSLFMSIDEQAYGVVQTFEKDASYFKQQSFIRGFQFASYYHDNMVLQQTPHPALIWGYGKIGATVLLRFQDEEYSTFVEKGPSGRGVWRVLLRPQKAGGPFSISAVHLDVGEPVAMISLKNILFGEVWVCGGQSNMQRGVDTIFNSTYEIEQAVRYPHVRLFYVSRISSDEELYDLQGVTLTWSVPTPDNVSSFSAVCWLYGRYLFDKLKVPVGLVHSSWGGTPVEAWSSTRALEACGLNNPTEPPLSPPPPQKNSMTWNSMIHPLLNMTIKGVVWYQGEQNTHYHKEKYNCSFPAMIEDWRSSWSEGTFEATSPSFPFGFVQLSVLNEPNWVDDGAYPTIRWHQTADYGYAPNPKMPDTFMAVSIDLLDTGIPYGSPHMRDKQDVAMRLALGAAHKVYHHDVVSDGPFPRAVYLSAVNRLTVEYQDTSKVIIGEAQGFQVCCVPSSCGQYDPFPLPTWTNTTVLTSRDHSLQLDVSLCTLGVSAVRYAWMVTPCQFKQCQVYNEAKLPAAPFYHKIL